jgi:thiosulfate/3-mercaptopyruvate sulfurtransferase
MTVAASDVRALAGTAGVRIVDARAPERYRGDVEPLDPVAGHIPGAVNHFFQRNLADGRFRTPDGLRDGFRESLGDVTADHVVCYCGSGVTACHNLLALEHAGMSGARLYPGSWSEWVADPTRPVERG